MSDYRWGPVAMDPAAAWPGMLGEAATSAQRWWWYDVDGAHLTTAPPGQMPGTTHLYAWAPERWWRWRVDVVADLEGDPAVVGAWLARAEAVGPAGRPARVTVRESASWPSRSDISADVSRVRLVSDLRDRAMTVLVERTSSLQFVEIADGPR